jgi:hypothetical protein
LWIWEPYIAARGLTVLAGPWCVGKTFLALAMAARVSMDRSVLLLTDGADWGCTAFLAVTGLPRKTGPAQAQRQGMQTFAGPAQSFVITDEGALEWAGVTDITGDELVAPVMVDVEERGSRAEAKEFLLKALANGRQLATDMEEARKAHDIADRTLKRARQDLNIQVYRDGKAWYWELPTVVKPNR